MKRVVTLLLICSVVLFAAVAPQNNDLKVNGVREQVSILPNSTIETVSESSERSIEGISKAPALLVDTTAVTLFYLEDFENGDNGWTQFDGTAPDPDGIFVLTDELTSGDSAWWCGQILGGYLSHWHVALETPEVILAGADSILSFYMEMAAEAPGVSGAYNGWDGGNVQITNDGGETWVILTPEGIPYNCTSMYSFGYEFNMGPGIPGWGGALSGDVTVNLAEYAGDTVQVRFVFASDPAQDYTDDNTLTGMVIDSIDVAGNATYNGAAADGLTSFGVNAASGAFWAIQETTDSIPSGNHYLENSDGATFAVGLEDYFVSPSMTLPDESNTLIFCDFEFYPDMGDETGDFPDVDFWRLEVSPDDGATWNAISNISGAADGDNFVYSDSIGAWIGFQSGYGEACELTDFAGKTVKFRFFFHSDLDTPSGSGLKIDDFVVYTQPDLPTPLNVVTAMNASDNIVISWDDMNGTYQQPKTLLSLTPATADGAYYGPGSTFFSDDSTAGYSLFQVYNTNEKDFNLTEVKWAVYPMTADEIMVSIVSYDTSAHLLYETESFVPAANSMDSIDITDQNITVNGEFWVGATWTTASKFPGWWAKEGGSGLLGTPTGVLYNVDYSTPFGVEGYGEVTYSGLKYNVYRREATGTALTEIAKDLDVNSCVDETASPLVEYVYYVVSAQDDFESTMSAGAHIFVTPAVYEEVAYDDGSAEKVFELAMDSMVVVKVTPSEYPVKLDAVRFLGLWAGDLYKVEIFKDNNGVPGDSWLKLEPEVTSVLGWNTWNVLDILTVTNDGIVLRDGESVWVGVKGNTVSFPAYFGVDTTGTLSGMAAFKTPTGNWTSLVPYVRGNPMIRTYLQTDIDTTAISTIVPTEYNLSQNYPNPFNPSTKIEFDLRAEGFTTVDVYDLTGRHVRTLISGKMNAGSYELNFDASALASGIYFYRLTSGEFSSIRKMSLIK